MELLRSHAVLFFFLFQSELNKEGWRCQAVEGLLPSDADLSRQSRHSWYFCLCPTCRSNTLNLTLILNLWGKFVERWTQAESAGLCIWRNVCTVQPILSSGFTRQHIYIIENLNSKMKMFWALKPKASKHQVQHVHESPQLDLYFPSLTFECSLLSALQRWINLKMNHSSEWHFLSGQPDKSTIKTVSLGKDLHAHSNEC